MSNVAAERPTDSRLLGVFTLLAGLVLLVLAFGFVGYNWTLPTYVVGCAVVLCGFGFFADFESAEKPDAPNIAEQRWATMADILAEDISDSNGGDNQFPYLGLVGGDNGGVTTLRYKGPRHLICYGPTRVGKSAAIIIPNLQNLRRSMIVTDPKGELAAITAAHRDKFGRVIVLNPFGLLIDKRPHLTSIGWNPLLQLDPESDDFSGDAMCIADAIIDRSGDGKSSFFENRAKEFFRAFIMHERITKGREASLYHLSSMLSRDLIKTLQAMALSENKIVGDAGLEFLRRKEDKNSQSSSLEDVIATIKANIYFLDDIRIGADMHLADAIDFSALHREIVTIYLILPTEKLEAQAKWLRLFVNLAIENLIRSARSDSEATVPPVLFMLDEFGSLGRLECIVKGLNMAASSRLQLFFFLQNVGQLKNSYERELDSFGSGCGASVTFKTGALDTGTAEYLSKAFGSRQILVHTQNDRGESVTPHASPLIRPEDIAGLKKGMTISVIEPCRWPIAGTAPLYVDTPFAAGLDPHPEHRERKVRSSAA